MAWTVIFTDRFNDWYQQQPEGLQDRIAALLWNLHYSGPLVGRPLVDTVKGSRYPNLKELRVQYGGEPWRIFLRLTLNVRPLCSAQAINEARNIFMTP